MRTSTNKGARRTARAALAVLALTLAAACSSGGDSDGRGGDGDKAPKTATGTLEQIAEQAECTPNIQTDAAEIRQANCTTGDGKYVLATFASDRGQREWINEANDYGGTYLVGRKWVAVGDAKVVTALRGRLGGEVETGTEHHEGSGGGSGEGETGHSEHHGS
ncbi:hypothetical protein [Streptomyces sp. NBC_00829]|uniref:hypothetical protein n=1 Tax=Streptomyces sp. NBC_00829 TaxID=2903679 RepID=UPI003869A3CA|nr:hypothetical protein OG293_26520 [Streptomyces sp. NBC_00829]